MLHTESHPLAGQTVKVKFAGEGHPQIENSKDVELEAVVEDYWDKLTGKSWGLSDGNPAAIIYGMRAGFARPPLPFDDEVLYVKIKRGQFAMGHLIHTSELVSE